VSLCALRGHPLKGCTNRMKRNPIALIEQELAEIAI
jgi:hypothetical protein